MNKTPNFSDENPFRIEYDRVWLSGIDATMITGDSPMAKTLLNSYGPEAIMRANKTRTDFDNRLRVGLAEIGEHNLFFSLFCPVCCKCGDPGEREYDYRFKVLLNGTSGSVHIGGTENDNVYCVSWRNGTVSEIREIALIPIRKFPL